MSADVSEPSLSIVVPSYNEERRLERTLPAIIAYLESHTDETAELIVVDDGSTDRTREVAEQAGKNGAVSLQLISNDGNRGKGYSVKRGILAARGRRVLFTDSDLSTPIDDFEALDAALAAGADVAIGSRAVAGADIVEHQAWYRELGGQSFNLVVRALAVPGIRDTQCGFKLFRREVVRPIFERVTIDRWGFDAELLFVARRLGYRVEEVPVHWRNDTESKVDFLRDGTTMLMDLLRIRWRHRDITPHGAA